MATLTIQIEGDESDLDFLKSRIIGHVEDALVELVEVYENNLDGDVTMSGWDVTA